MTGSCFPETLILGCGNTLFGDDGFGPAVAAELAGRPDLPDGTLALDVGTGASDILFDLVLDPGAVKRLIIIDALAGDDLSAETRTDDAPAGLGFIRPEDLPREKAEVFAVHGRPSLNLLTELARRPGFRVDILAARVEPLPDRVAPGLSVRAAALLAPARRRVLQSLSNPTEQRPG